jgi:hypothetical protein
MSSSSARNVLVKDTFTFEKVFNRCQFLKEKNYIMFLIFFFRQSLFQNDDSSENFVTSSSLTFNNKTHKEEKLLTGNNLITESAADNSFFPNSFDENGYVFDGVKIDVI